MQKENAPAEIHESALEQRNSTPEYPTPNTQPARLLAVLLHGQKVHPLAGWRQLGIYRLSDTAFQLRGMSWPVVTGRLNVSNRFDELCYVAQYYLTPDAIHSAGDRGRKFAEAELSRMQKGKAA